MPIWGRNIKSEDLHKHRIWEGLRLHLGGSGTIWGVSWALLGASWPSWGRSKSSFFFNIGPRWSPRSLLDGFWVVLGRLGGGLKKLCGLISKDLGLNAGKGWEELGRIGTAGQKVGESFGKLKKKHGCSHVCP